jgi:hypothetical protein
MSEGEGQDTVAAEPTVANCAECGTKIEPGMDHEVTDNGTFCRPCYNNLVAQIQRSVAAQSENINYPMAFVGALGGAALGVLAWWGFTVLTQVAFGLVAIVIGIAVAKGAVFLSGNKRSRGLQGMSILISCLAFFYANYLVTRSFVHKAFEEEGVEGVLPLLPDLSTFVEVTQLSFSPIDLVFLAIVIYEAWKIPAPIPLGPTT